MTRSDSPKRGRRPADEAERKDRIIQTRVPKDLESTLKEAAERERVSVSHLIRNVLEDTFNLVDNIVADSAHLVDSVRRDALKLAASARGENAKTAPPAQHTAPGSHASAAELLADVDAWQDVIVNKPTQCVSCSIELKRGTRAFRGLNNANTASVWLCSDCLENL